MGTGAWAPARVSTRAHGTGARRAAAGPRGSALSHLFLNYENVLDTGALLTHDAR